MTTNQINYQKMLEEGRHNLAVEAETKRQNLRDIKVREKQIQSNYDIAQDQLVHNRNVLSETKRHNLAVEQKDLMYATRMLDETQRHNLEQERISNRDLDLTQQQINNNFAIGMANVDVARSQVALGHANLRELNRHNIQAEAELLRHNTKLEQNEALKINNDYALNASRNRREAIKISNDYELNSARNAETQRANVQHELNQYKILEEQKRHNLISEGVQHRTQVTNTLTNISEQLNKWFKTFDH